MLHTRRWPALAVALLVALLAAPLESRLLDRVQRARAAGPPAAAPPPSPPTPTLLPALPANHTAGCVAGGAPCARSVVRVLPTPLPD